MKKFSLIATLLLVLGVTVFAQDEGEMKVPPRNKTGKITVITDPPNSDVYLGGKYMGKSPITEKSVPSGRQTLVVVDQGYELVNLRFNVWPDSNNVYEARTVIPKGGIEVTTVPGKCYIKIDGESADYTDGASLLVKNLDAGDHMVRAECGNKAKEQMVTVKGEEVTKVTIEVNKK